MECEPLYMYGNGDYPDSGHENGSDPLSTDRPGVISGPAGYDPKLHHEANNLTFLIKQAHHYLNG